MSHYLSAFGFSSPFFVFGLVAEAQNDLFSYTNSINNNNTQLWPDNPLVASTTTTAATCQRYLMDLYVVETRVIHVGPCVKSSGIRDKLGKVLHVTSWC